ncbi:MULTISPECIES: divalent-cation tolerance protein CutA [Actinomycetes]|uniref:Divalent cation tolerance protein n=3 Tax=Amycolatopsis TaxID=1813 RepID=A0A1I5ERE6_9PSEU|nr:MULTISPECIES: divalent-cation tolerance protein CutA [Actinomycetes]ATY15900.1 divalent-cation tolerance protein CutA [Amycolatopsis sp. AA4]MBB1156711.1 divalent-cation tolerance protein CutA [Amycolatopsis dendrobii]MCG3749352.1 divalent-cation tolerance protein CutA [Amycolatopsis sp. Poz14]MYW97054.1 divalent cation tolerance protein CutA [Amycolatopsis rubida]NEC62039.1 divalent-cation tolerance protein CutA [Amycolatopsis rubida]
MSADHVVVTTTVDSEAAARTIAASAIEARLAACAQIVGPITSVFRWEDEVQTAAEWRVECKTAADRSGALEEFLNVRHPYDLPEVIVTPIVGGSPRYLSWLVEETR